MKDFLQRDAHGFVGRMRVHDICHVGPPALHDLRCGECVKGGRVGGLEHSKKGEGIFIEEDGVVGDPGRLEDIGTKKILK